MVSKVYRIHNYYLKNVRVFVVAGEEEYYLGKATEEY